MYIIDYIKEVFKESSIRKICNRHLKTSLSTATSNQNIGVFYVNLNLEQATRKLLFFYKIIIHNFLNISFNISSKETRCSIEKVRSFEPFAHCSKHLVLNTSTHEFLQYST